MYRTNEALNNIDNYIKDHPDQTDIITQLTSYRQRAQLLESAINRKDFKAAFIGKIGVGKTSTICKLLDLQYREPDSDEMVDILKTGAGRTTVCEVAIEYAERYSIAINPMAENEIKQTVSDFAEFIWNKIKKNIGEEDEGGSLLSEEMNRCIRNMLGLSIKRERTSDGRSKSIDKAVELATSCNSIDELKELMFACLAIEDRTELEIWPSPDEHKDWVKWLKNNFADINDGKNKKMSLPERLIIKGPFKLDIDDLSWTIVDTRGIDGNVSRADLRKVLCEDGTFPIITSSFNDAPDADARAVLEMGCNLGYLDKLRREAVLLVLDKDESHKVADVDISLSKLEKVAEGRIIRQEQVLNRLQHDLKWDGVVDFFNCKQEQPEALYLLLRNRYKAYLDYYNAELASVLSAINEILNAEEQRYNDFRNALQALYIEWRQNADKDAPSWDNFGQKLCRRLEKTHHRVLAASIRRHGSYSNLDFYEVIREIATKASNKFVKEKISDLQTNLTLMSDSQGFDEFRDQIISEQRKIEREMQAFSEQIGDLATQFWLNILDGKDDMWDDWDGEWGMGSGYKKRVINKISLWINTSEPVNMHQHFLRTVAAKWGRVLK